MKRPLITSLLFKAHPNVSFEILLDIEIPSYHFGRHIVGRRMVSKVCSKLINLPH